MVFILKALINVLTVAITTTLLSTLIMEKEATITKYAYVCIYNIFFVCFFFNCVCFLVYVCVSNKTKSEFETKYHTLTYCYQAYCSPRIEKTSFCQIGRGPVNNLSTVVSEQIVKKNDIASEASEKNFQAF